MPKTLRLILGDQLNYKHSWFGTRDDNVTYVLMEMRQETDYVRHHIQKVVAFFAAMRQFAGWLEERGHRVIYYRLDDDANQQQLTKNLDQLIQEHGFERFEYLLPDEYRLDQQLRKYSEQLDLETGVQDTEHFITKRMDLRDFFGEKNYLMETFYRDIRKQHGWLMNDSGPEGGKWNYDHQNRKSLPRDVEVVTPRTFRNGVAGIVALLEKEQVDTFGSIDEEHFIWPINREQSLIVLRFFLDECFANFGDYQDAMHTDHWSLFHSRLSFAMNTKMLSPVEITERAIAYYRENESVDLAATEGFVRQIIGWREFMRGVYWAKMPGYESENFLDHRRHLPEFFWTGETNMNCLRHAITQSLDYAYAHHIQRLMITGNFALLANIDPDQVDAWYLGIYIDAIQWVELPNTRGMSQFADGGVVATKPYVSSANYINKMSNYCKDCHYNYKEKTGEKACPFNSLYWNFLLRHENKLADNGRMNMMYSLLNRKSAEEKEALIQQAERYLRKIDEL